MELTERERKVLGVIEHRAGLPINETAKFARLKVSSLRYCISRFTERGVIIGQAPFINVYPLGLTDYTIFFSLAALTAAQKARLLQQLISSTCVSWVGSLGGEYQLGVAVTAERIQEVPRLFRNLGKDFENIFHQKTVSVRIHFTAFGRKYLAPLLPPPALTACSNEDQRVELDPTDKLILSTLSDRGHNSQREISRLTGVPLSTVTRRIAKLEELGVICGYLFRYNLSKLGFSTYRILIHTRGVSVGFRDKLYAYAKAHPRVIHFVECLGVWDYELGVEIEDASQLNQVIEELYEKFGEAIYGTKTLQIFRHLKYSSFPFSKGGPSDGVRPQAG
jgi:DNA-binding Lrp family transcriptional regulator